MTPAGRRAIAISALGCRATITVDDPAVSAHLRDVFCRLMAPDERVGGAHDAVEVVASADPPRIVLDGEVVWSGPPAQLLIEVARTLNRLVVRTSDRWLLVHAAVARLGDALAVFPGAPEAGKSTLVTGLVRAGWQHLSDELAPIDPTTGEVSPYPRAIGLDPGSWPLFPELAPAVPGTVEPYLAEQWLVAPTALRPGAPELIGAGGRPTMVVFPRYAEGATTALERVSPATAVHELAASAVNLDVHGRTGFDALVHLVEGAWCARLVSGELDTAVRLVTAAAGGTLR